MSWHLALTVDRRARTPMVIQINNALRRLIENGTLQPGSRLPSSRQLATDLAISRSVVVEAYEQLAAEGYLVTRRGSGTWVGDNARSVSVGSVLVPDSAAHLAGVRWDLRTAFSDLQAFPRQAWLRSVTAVLAQAGTAELGYGPPSGVPLTRAVLAAYLGRVRSVRSRPENLMVTSGFAQGLSLLCKVLRDQGHEALAVEDPGHPGEWEFIAGSGLQPVAIPVDENGLRVDLLRASGARAVLTTPSHQFPTGVRLSAERRESLVAWAREVGGYIVEDDFDNAYLEPADRVAALQSLAPDRVIYAGSVSKVLAPALRLGWLVAPAELMASIEYARAGWDIGCSGIEQLTLTHFIATGEYDRHQRRLRTEFRRRREVIRRLVPHRLPGARIISRDHGLQTYLLLPPRVSEEALVRAARSRSILLHGGTHFALAPNIPRPPAIVLGHAGVNEEDLDQVLAELGQICQQLTDS
ncbi:PLP-dependent aminotransferase family protein [Streptomyces orinoci]|uniref:PLP-dependent aminotransferase family protein n=1 Tax=Streptomyces orinoci TaxID=67339 RepID=A0ABV3JQU8_STRON|nr:PLP-dependent aminotransferase family protein [Streptomyces orinoci]